MQKTLFSMNYEEKGEEKMCKKEITSILLIAGTCIGSGTIAFPMVLAKLGIIPSIIIMLIIWILNYYPSLSVMELNLRSEQGLSLGTLGKKISGKWAQMVGEISVKIISYALLTTYLYGSASIIQKLLEEYFNYALSVFTVETIIATFGILLLLLPLKIVSEINGMISSCLIFGFAILLGTIFILIDYHKIPWITNATPVNIISVCPIMFAAYGYQLILHTLRNYCGQDVLMLKHGILFGSLLPTLLYMLWSCFSLCVIFKSNPGFFIQLAAEKIEVGEFVIQLANVSSLSNFHAMVWLISILAIFTSFIGFSLGLAESWNFSLTKCSNLKNMQTSKFISSVLTVCPAYVIAAIVPNAFVKVFSFAGAMFVITGILLPVYLLFKDGMHNLHYKELKKWPLILCVFFGFCIIAVEIFINN